MLHTGPNIYVSFFICFRYVSKAILMVIIKQTKVLKQVSKGLMHIIIQEGNLPFSKEDLTMPAVKVSEQLHAYSQ